MPIVPDTKNWTWVLDRRCPECGLNVRELSFEELPALVRANVAQWHPLLLGSNVRVRPDDSTWSVLEYAAHVRDVFQIFRERLSLMLDQDSPAFPSWDQDAAALAERYNEQDPLIVSAELIESGEAMADALESVPATSLTRGGLRSDGAHFTVDSLAHYFLHDPVHHLWDVRSQPGHASRSDS